MYAFADETSHDYITDPRPCRHELTPDMSIREVADSMRAVVPMGYVDERLFSYDELEPEWRVVQTAQIIGHTFSELFRASQPDYPTIAQTAQAWQQDLMDQWHGDEQRADEWRLARQLLQGVIDAAHAGAQGHLGRWTPSQRGFNLSARRPTNESPKTGRWFEARAVDNTDWRVRKSNDQVEAVRLDDGTSRLLTREQARMTLKIVA